MDTLTKTSPNSYGNEEVPTEAVRASVEWITEDVHSVASSFALEPTALLEAILEEFESGGLLTCLRRR